MLLKKQFVLFIMVLLLLSAYGCGADNRTVPPSVSPLPTQSVEAENVSPSQPPNNLPTSTPIPSATAVPTASSEAEAFMLAPYKTGDKGEDVELIQNMLIALGFDPGESDGTFGNQMKKAVENFQLYAGLDVDGIAGQATLDALSQRYDAAASAFVQTEQPLIGITIGLDPGHQRHDNDGTEPVMPGSDDLKKKVSSGTYGRFSGVPEYAVNLQVGLKLKAALESLGAKVVMTRETHGVDIPNSQRATMMNEAGVNCWLRIHANGTDNPKTHGMFILVPAKGSMNTTSDTVQQESVSLAEVLLKHTLDSTGATDLGIQKRSDQTGFGWSAVPVCNIEMGHMTNETEDFSLVSEAYQEKIVEGLAQGFIDFFK